MVDRLNPQPAGLLPVCPSFAQNRTAIKVHRFLEQISGSFTELFNSMVRALFP